MSVISNIHTSVVYNAKASNGCAKSIPLFGQRGVVTIAKADSKGNYGQHLQQTMFTSVPQLTVTDIDFTNVRIVEHCLEYFKKVQNSIISDALKSGQKSVTTEQLSQSGVLNYLEEENSSDKWDAARIASWFSDNLAEPLGLKLLESGKTEEQMEKILIATQKRFADTLASRAKISLLMTNELNKAISFAEDKTDSAYTKFYNRLNPPQVEISLEDSLGF